MRGTSRVVLFVVFAVTGFSALTVQVVWQRVIALHAGVDLVSFTTVVAAFLAGLGLGSLLGGWLADRLGARRSVLAFAASNLAIGVFAWMSVWLFYDVYEAHAEQLGSTAAKFAFNVALLLVPTTLMGLSLPLVARGVVGRIGEAGTLLGRLYAVNTLGAAAGAALSGWVLQGTLGFVATVRLAGTLNLMAAALVLLVGLRTPADSSAPPEPERSGEARYVDTDGAGSAGGRVWPWYVVYGLTGAVALGFELVFFRATDAIMRSNSYSFAHVLAGYLIFFGVGAVVGAAIVKRTTRPDRWFLGLQFLVGLTALVGLIFLVRVIPHTPAAAKVTNYFTGDGFDYGFTKPDGTANGAFFPVFFGVPVLLMFAPVLCMGASYPCAQALVSRRVDTLGRHTGLLLFANIVGNVVGTLLVGFVAIEHLGTSGTYRLLALLLLGPGVAAAWLSGGRLRLAYAGATIAVVLLFVAVFPSQQLLWAYLHGVSKDELALAEDRSCANAIKTVDDQQVLTVNGSSQNNYPFDDFHVLIGLTPAVLHPNPQMAMALGLGIGATPYGMAVDPRLRDITTVEICGGEITLLKGLAEKGAPELRRFFDDDRQTLVVGDGRDHLLRTDQQYDVVVVDTLRPQAAFSGSLYSVEFYELVKDHLTPSGLMAQWAPTPRVVNTVTEVFPYVVRFVVPAYDNSMFLVAGTSPIVVDKAAMLARFDADVAAGAFSPEQAGSLRAFLSDAQVQCLKDGGPAEPVPDSWVNTDLRPRDEYFLNNSTDVPERAPACT